MVQFKFVKEAPKNLEKGDYVITAPDFMEEIVKHQTKAPRNGLTGSYHLRMITDTVAQNYDPEGMSAYSVKTHNYEGRAFSSNEELSKILIDMYTADCPGVFLKYVDTKIRTRPAHTTMIYYVDTGIKSVYDLFHRYGFTEVRDTKPTKEKSTKVVGKPAITNEDAEKLNQNDSTDEQN